MTVIILAGSLDMRQSKAIALKLRPMIEIGTPMLRPSVSLYEASGTDPRK